MRSQRIGHDRAKKHLYIRASLIVGKESTCNAGDPGLISGSGRTAGEGIGYPLQFSWASPVAQLVKSVCNEGDLDSIPGLGRSPREGKGYHSSILAQRIPRTILYVVVCIRQSQPPNSSLPFLSSLVTISLFSISVTLFLFYKLVHLFHFLRFC